jgi:hypothetical protein
MPRQVYHTIAALQSLQCRVKIVQINLLISEFSAKILALGIVGCSVNADNTVVSLKRADNDAFAN